MQRLKKSFFSLLIFLFAFPCFLFAEESLTITTYYPSPYGSYNELSTTGNTYLATAGGNVGIGTASPNSPLEVFKYLAPGNSQDILRLTHYGTADWNFNIREIHPVGGGNVLWSLGTTHAGTIYNNTIVLDRGSVGIGTTGPKHKLQMISDGSGSALALFTSTYDAIQVWGTRMYKSDTGGGIPFIVESQNGSTWYESARFDDGQTVGTHPSFQTRSHTYLAASSGNVGIGTTAPTAKLEVKGQYFSAKYTTTTTLDWNNGNVQYKQLASGAQAFTFTNGKDGGRYILILKQPASGAAGTVTWPATVLWPGGTAPSLTTTYSKVDVITFVADTTNTKYYGGSSLNY